MYATRLEPDYSFYYTDADKSLTERMDQTYADAITINQSFWSEADIDTRFEAGDQTLWNDIYGNLPAFRRRVFNFNRIRRVVQMISGYQRRNRKSFRVIPVENADSATATQFTKVMSWATEQDGTLDTISSAFHGALVTGMNLLAPWMDYRRDPVNGDIRVDHISYNGFLIDPYFRKPDLSDCNFVWTRRWLTKPQAKSLLPGREKEIDQMRGEGNRDGRFQFQPESYAYGMTNLLTYDEFFYRDYRDAKLLVDVKTGETMEWRGKDAELKEYLDAFAQITVLNTSVPTTKLGILLEGRPVYHGPNPMGIDEFPFVPVFAYYSPQIPYFPWRIQGVVRGLRDSQYLYNRRKVIELDILESQINSGYKYKENALVNPKDVFLQGQGRGLAIKRDAAMTDVEAIRAPDIPPSMIQLSTLLGEEIQQISGVNEELIGSADDEKAGILAMLRQGAGLTTLQSLFDQLDLSQRLLGRIFMSLIQSNFSPGKIERIIEEKPSLQFYSKAFGRYDSVVEEGMYSATQRQMQFAQLLSLREAGLPIPMEAIMEASSFQGKEKILEQMQAQQQQEMQQLQQQKQYEEAEKIATLQLAQARATAEQGLGIERMSRVAENQALAKERLAEAIKDRELGVLHIVEAMKKIEDLDYAQMEKIIRMGQMIKAQTMGEEAALEAELSRAPAVATPAMQGTPLPTQPAHTEGTL